MAVDRCYKQPKIVTICSVLLNCECELLPLVLRIESVVGDGASISLSKTFHYIHVYC